MIGQILIHFLFGASAIMTALYFLSYRKSSDALRGLARNFYLVVTGGIVAASIGILVQILTHNFQFTYVWSYSSRELPTHLLISTFYAGQEGSFLLWTLLTALIGAALLPYVRKHKYESEVMMSFGLILSCLLLVLLFKNPFFYVWESFAKDGIAEGFTPQNGKGLNPLLQNVWIVIHPPILFTGFAAMTVPFAFALAALIKREYHKWIDVALPWTLFSTAILGFGIMLGGWWAYETLGWGGFWAWDPVENSSLIPWLVGAALVHTMIVQRKTKGLIRTNIVLSLAVYMLVLYSTFLTRSGVLGDTSVHSFVDPGMFTFALLVGYLILFGGLGAGLLLYRRRDFPAKIRDFDSSSRELAVSLGAVLLLCSAAIVLIGTSWPIITELIGIPKVKVEEKFYNIMHLPLMIVVMLINGISLLMRWKSSSWQDVVKKSLLSLVLSTIATGILFAAGMRDPAYVALMFASWFALFINADTLMKIVRGNPRYVGAYVSHAGVALMMMGIIATSRYTEFSHARLVQGQKQKLFGYELTFMGREQVERHYADREKYKFHIKVAKDGNEKTVSPVLYWSDFNKRQSAFLEPGIGYSLTHDVYVSPKDIQTEGKYASVLLSKQDRAAFPTDTAIQFTLQRFDMSGAMAGGNPNELRLATVVTIERNGKAEDHTLYVKFNPQTQASTPEWYTLPGTTQVIGLAKIHPNRENISLSKAEFNFFDESKPATMPKEIFIVEFSIKPFINLVWAGVIAMVLGFFISILRHRDELRRKLSREEKAALRETASEEQLQSA